MRHWTSIWLIFLLVALATSCTDQDNSDLTTEGIIQHTVYFYLNPDVTEEQVDDFEEGLSELMQIETVYTYEIGKPANTEEREVTDHTYEYSIFSWFVTMEDYEVYADHPVHLEFIDQYSELWEDVKVYDSIIFESSR